MNQQPQQAISRRAQSSAQAMGTYRFLHNPRVEPAMIGQASFDLTREAIARESVTLLLHDMTELKPVCDVSATKLLQYSVLAVGGGDQPTVGGLMHQRWFDDPKVPAGETRKERRSRWTRSQVWPEAVEALRGKGQTAEVYGGNMAGDEASGASGACGDGGSGGGASGGGGRWIHVADREADDFQMFEACAQAGDGFVIRSQHDRYLTDGRRLRDAMGRADVLGCCEVDVPRRSGSKVRGLGRWDRRQRPASRVRCVLRCMRVTLAPPQNDPRYGAGFEVSVVQIQQLDGAEGDDRIDWLLLCSGPVDGLADAMRMVGWYRRRWLIEEFHKAQKTGCRLEATQLKSADAVVRLAAICGVMAVGMLQLRDAATASDKGDEPLAVEHIDGLWVAVVSKLCDHADPATLSLKQFYEQIARQGGYLFRKNDPRPGWQCLWQGIQQIRQYVDAIQRLGLNLGE